MTTKNASDATNKAASDNASSFRGADAQINAHRQQHQAKLKKIALMVAIVIVVIVLIFTALNMMSVTPKTQTDAQQTVLASSLSESQLAEFREQFKHALAQYEVELQAQINSILLTNWEPSKANELSFVKEQALTAFAQGAFLQAKQHLETLTMSSQTLIDQWQAETQTHLMKAQQAFADNLIPQSQLNLNKAKALMPLNQDALALQNRIDAYGEISILLSELEIAKVENNLPKQIDLLAGIIKLDPELNEYSDELNDAKVNYDQQQLANLLQQAEKALAANQLQQAEKLVQQAQKLKPNGQGAKALNARIASVKASQSLARVKQTLAQLKSQDNWQEVANLVTKNLTKYPSDKELETYQKQAQQVLQAKQSLAIFIQQPERLADQNIRNAATDRVQQALLPSILSPSLQVQMAQVGASIDKYISPVSVNIESDGNTYIVVLGVGHVGSHERKKIELTPGAYVLQGKREGYRNKRVEFTVKANQSMSVTLICDQVL